MNLYLTHRCNRGCPFCFARKVLQDAGNNLDEIMSISEVKTLLDHFPEIENSIRNIGLLGGEPFLYPYLDELLNLLSERGVSAKVFTSATNTMPDILKEMSIDNAVGKINFVVNVGTRDTYSEKQYQNLDVFLRHYAPLASLSFTIFNLQTNPTYLFDLIDGYGLCRNIRVGIALPILYGGNQYIALNDYKKAGSYLVDVAKQAAIRGITLSMDCGFIACMFTDQQIGELLRLGTGVHFLCGAAIDIGPRLEAWNCFPLFQTGRVDALRTDNLSKLEQMLKSATATHTGSSCGILPECTECRLMQRGLCEGGCLSFKSIQ